jgi:DNA helicase TIP49 (TBP-interacting protein)
MLRNIGKRSGSILAPAPGYAVSKPVALIMSAEYEIGNTIPFAYMAGLEMPSTPRSTSLYITATTRRLIVVR